MRYFLVIIVFILSSCTSSDQDKINSVKNGIMDGHKAITVGQAFDKWSGCESKTQSWLLTKTDNGTNIIIFNCKSNLDVFEKTYSFMVGNENGGQENVKYVDIKSIEYKAIWVLNKDDSFELKNVVLSFVWNDDKSVEWTPVTNVQEALINQVYSNKQLFSNLETNPYGNNLSILATLYSEAK
jgi:hypothetical protein